MNARFDSVDGRLDAVDKGVNARLDTLGGRLDAVDKGLSARLETVETGLSDVRADVGELKAHLFEVRDAMFADSAKNRDFVSIKVEALRSEVKVYADGVIAHGEKLDDHETRITKLERR